MHPQTHKGALGGYLECEMGLKMKTFEKLKGVHHGEDEHFLIPMSPMIL